MMRTCSICTHEERDAIEKALLAGDSLRRIAERFGTSSTALHRHKQHIETAKTEPSQLAREQVQHDEDEGAHYLRRALNLIGIGIWVGDDPIRWAADMLHQEGFLVKKLS